MTDFRQARLVIFTSPNGRDQWQPIEPFAVPEWLKDPAIMGRLVAGEQCMDPRSVSKTDWFRAERVMTSAEKTAEDKRQRRQAGAAGRVKKMVTDATKEAHRQVKTVH